MSARVELETVQARRPEMIVLCWRGAHKLPDPRSARKRAGWSDLPAVRNGRVHAVLEPDFGRPGPRLVGGLEELARLLHPERFG